MRWEIYIGRPQDLGLALRGSQQKILHQVENSVEVYQVNDGQRRSSRSQAYRLEGIRENERAEGEFCTVAKNTTDLYSSFLTSLALWRRNLQSAS
jgi:hypothetical protein